MRQRQPICPYCGKVSKLVTGRVIYPTRPELHEKAFYSCKGCNAYVGCHPGTTRPLGRLADPQLRRAKVAAHAAFDPLWESGRMKRPAAYAWLAGRLGIPTEKCHVGMFDLETCRRVVELCRDSIQSAATAG